MKRKNNLKNNKHKKPIYPCGDQNQQIAQRLIVCCFE